MENLAINQFANAYRGKRVLVTGHTGFKGSWLTLWLSELGAQIAGISLAPETQLNHWALLNLRIDQRIQDIRAFDPFKRAMDEIQPEIVFHLAAQPLVRRSYRNPLETWSTNVMGTAHVLEACRLQPSVRAIVVVTTDKCYENKEWVRGYLEEDPLGGHDAYSASKAAAELVAASYRSAFLYRSDSSLLATARAGNVIGGGDWSEDRLIPDLLRSFEKRQPLEIRSPGAVRPWQHVLESLSGYLMLGERLMAGDTAFAESWNFGPSKDGNITVADMLSKLKQLWPVLTWSPSDQYHPHEAKLLYLDSSKAKSRLKWQPVWDTDTALAKTVEWYRIMLEGQKIISQRQLAEYTAAAQKANLVWAS